LFDTLANVSEPGHPHRGKYISQDKVSLDPMAAVQLAMSAAAHR
jgi:hypothetical protein